MRSSLFGSFLAILALAVGARAEDTYTIKLKPLPDDGKSITISNTESTTASNKVTDANGKVFDDGKKHTETREETYAETVLEKGDKRPNKYKRAYEKATLTRDGKTETRSYEGRTLIFENKDGKYTVSVEGDKPVSKEDLADLTSRANEPSDKQHELFLAPKPVKVGGTWKVDGKKIAEIIPQRLDLERTSGEGKLTKVYQKDSHTFGVIVLTLKMAIALPKGAEFEKQPVLEFKLTLDTAIDGSSTAGVLTGSGGMASKGTIEQGGQKFTVESNLDVSGKRTQSAEK